MAASTPSIEKLQKKLEKEPNSLIFLQLAEEYRKESQYDQALRTCQDGLRRHPNYWSARVAMGRIYYEMGSSDKAREELEKVTKAVPDNLLANKLLGDIYMESGRMPDAYKRYQIVQMLTPNDQEVVANLQRIESQMMNPAPRPEPKPAPPPPPPPPEPEPEPATLLLEDEPLEEAPPPPTLQIPDLLEKTAPGARSRSMDLMDSTMPQHRSVAPPPVPIAPEQEPVSTQITPEPTDLAAMFMESAHSNEVPVAPSFASNEEINFTPPFAAAPIEAPAENPDPVVEPEKKPRPEDRTQPMQDKEDAAEFDGDELTTQTLAELYVQQGLTDKAVKVFQKLLLNDPGNQLIIQRLRELSPADALLSMAASPEEREFPSDSISRNVRESTPFIGSNSNQPSDDRRRKITTLENWLAAIRRERS